MSTLLTTASAMDVQALQVGEPIRYDLSGGDRYYYIQDVKYNGQDLYLQSDWFTSEGPKRSQFNKLEMLVKIDSKLKQILKELQQVLKDKVTYPSEYQILENQKDEYFKCLPDKTFIFGKVGQGVQCYDKTRKSIAFEKLQYGNYRVIFLLKGIYIGRHCQSTHLSSLHLKIQQIQCEAVNMPCLFSLVPSVTPQNQEMSTIDLTPVSTAISAQPAKKARRPRVQRASAVSEPQDMETDGDATFDNLAQKSRRGRVQRQNAVAVNEAQNMQTDMDDIFDTLGL